MPRTTILDLDAKEALFFFLDSKIYSSLDFPTYITFGSLLTSINTFYRLTLIYSIKHIQKIMRMSIIS